MKNKIGKYREYFSMVSIETKTIVETIENAQGFDFLKKSKHGGSRVSIQGCDRNPDRNPDRNLWRPGFD